jgi:uncharacterized protein YebE (UPF0316 family)
MLPLVASADPAVPALAAPIFLAELCVVTLGTLRIIFVSRGHKALAPLFGFFEVSLWLFAIGQTMQNLGKPACCAAFAGGFAAGNFLGVLIEERLALGTSVVRVITHKDAGPLIEGLKAAGYGVTTIDAQGATGPVRIVLTVVRRKDRGDVLALVRRFGGKAFCSVDDLQSAAEGVFPADGTRPGRRLLGVLLRPLRPGR